MLGRLNLSSLQSNAQHLVTTLSSHDPGSVADALLDQPARVSYNQQGQQVNVRVGSSRSASHRAVQLQGQAYISRGWAASHLRLSNRKFQQVSSSDANIPVLERVSHQAPASQCFLLCCVQGQRSMSVIKPSANLQHSAGW